MDGPPPQEEDFTTIPISDRLTHKNWKARVSAYESLIKIFQATASDTDPAFKPYLRDYDLLKKIAADTNAVAQEKGVECLISLVKFAGETAAKTRESVMPILVDKCFGSSRAGTKNNAVELALQYVEVENGGAGVVANILQGLDAKQPKTVAGCIFALKEIYRLFGGQATPTPPVLKALPKIFSHNDKAVRAEGTLLTHALYGHLGPAIEPWLADLKPVQVKELKDSFEAMEREGKGKGSVKPKRMTRAQAREAEEREALGADDPTGENHEEDVAPPDPRLFAEPVDIVPRLSSSLQTMLASSKWKDRKEALDDLSTLLNTTPRIKDAPELGEVIKSLAARIHGDANINCVIAAAVCMELLAKGMQGSFARFREAVVGHMLERLKERKANVTGAIGTALDAVFLSTTLPDIIPDILPALASKNPQVKEGTLKYLGRCLSTSATSIQSTQIKTLSEPLVTLLEDGYEGARNEAAFCLGALIKMVGERPMNAVLEGLADVRKAKVKEASEKATVRSKLGTGGPVKTSAGTKKAAPKKAETSKSASLAADDGDDPPPPKPRAKAVAKSVKKTPPTAGTSTSAAAPPAKKAGAAPSAAPSKPSKGTTQPGVLDTFKYKHTPEDSEALAAELIPSTFLTDLGDANWKTRLAALEEMIAWVESTIEELDAEVIVRALAKRGWGEKNFQVSAKLYAILSTLAERCPSFGRSCPALCVGHLTEKLGDMKLKKPAGDTLVAFAERTSLQFVLSQAYEPLSKQKAPKVLADALSWVNSALTEFGIAGLSLRALIEFLKMTLQNSNAAVRTSATKALVTLKLFAGSSVKDLLEDLNPQLLGTINSEFDKVDGMAAPEPSRTSADVAAITPSASGKGGAPGAVDPLDDIFPRVEIDSLLKGTTILADSKSDAWKTKKEALEALQAILDQGSNKRLKPTMGEIGQVLKARVTDTNKAVQTLALDIIARIATGMGKPFEKYTRLFALPVATVLADQKAAMRAAAFQTLTAIAVACDGVESMIHGLTSALETTNPVQKASLLQWLIDWFKVHEPSPSLDLSNWATSVVSSLDDRNSDVRRNSQALLPYLILCAGFDYVLQQTNSLKPASRTSAIPIIQAARLAVPAAVSPPPPPPPTLPAKPPIPAAPPVSPDIEPDLPASKVLPPGKLTGVRRKLPQGTSRPESITEGSADASSRPLAQAGLSRPGATAASTPKESAFQIASTLPFTSPNSEVRKGRLAKDGTRWINEGGSTRKDLAELLQHQMESTASKELITRLFSHDHNAVTDHITGLTTMIELYSRGEADAGVEEIRSVCLANFDLPLKYASIKAHEPQPNLISKCLEAVEAVLAFLRSIEYQLTETEALCFIPTMIYKLGDAREQVRVRVQQIIQGLPKVYAYSRVFQLLLEHGLKSKVAKTRQGALDEMAGLLKRSGMGACEPSKAFPLIAAMIADKDAQVRKSALTTLSEAYTFVGEKVWTLVGSLSPKDKTQLEERLRRVAGPSTPGKSLAQALPSQGARLATGIPRAGSPVAVPRAGGIPRAASPSTAGVSKLACPSSPARTVRSESPAAANIARPISPAVPPSPTGVARPKSLLPSRLGRPRANPLASAGSQAVSVPPDTASSRMANGHPLPSYAKSADHANKNADGNTVQSNGQDDITITISSILSSDPNRSVEALKRVQKILSVGPEAGPSSPQYRELAEHTEGLIETITLQMAHVFEAPGDLIPDDNFRLAKHLIQTLNNFCDHGFLAESLTVDILTSLLEELTLRLLETDDSPVKKVKDLSRFINMIILRLFATGRRMSIFRALFALLLQIVKPFPTNGTQAEAKEAKVAELVLKCVWKLARNIPQDLTEQHLDPVELFPAIEHFLQSVPPNEWRARATNKVPCGDMPLRTIKVIIQHVVAHYGDEVYDLLSASFDDPSATIVYPYVYRILNSSARTASDAPSKRNGTAHEETSRPESPSHSRPASPHETASSAVSVGNRQSAPSHRTSPSSSSVNGNGQFSPPVQEPDPDAQLLGIIGHISSETTGAMHKEGITELHHFLKAYPHKRPRVEKMLESTGASFRKYITRALASRAAEDEEREVAVVDTLSKLESHRDTVLGSPVSSKFDQHARRSSLVDIAKTDKLNRLHDIFQYRSSTTSNSSSHGRSTPSAVSPPLPRASPS